MTDKYHVLDHGFVRLVASMGNDLSVVRSARVSYDAAWRAGEDEGSDKRLIRYLWKHKHTTPFEAVTFTFEVMAPIFVLRQWHRHRTWSYNELSARYRELPDIFYVPVPRVLGKPAKDNKQGRDIDWQAEPSMSAIASTVAMRKMCEDAFLNYEALLLQGVPRELARAVLPLATYSHMFATVNLWNLLRFIKLRDHTHAQYEIREYAKALRELIQPIVPACLEAFDNE